MHGIESQQAPPGAVIGPTLVKEVLLDQVPVQALLDTGFPMSTVSLACFLCSAAKNRTLTNHQLSGENPPTADSNRPHSSCGVMGATSWPLWTKWAAACPKTNVP